MSGTSTKQQDERRFVINIQLANDGEPKRVFVGVNGKDCLIERGKDVTVTAAQMSVLDDAVQGIAEVDPEDPDKIVITQRKRFPYTIVRAL